MGDSAEKQKRLSFFKGAKAEFKKISWPDRQSTLKQSVAVVAISVVVGVIIAVLDYFIQYGVNFLTSYRARVIVWQRKMVCSPYLFRI